MGSFCRERAVNVVVTFAMKIAIVMRPNKIQTTEKIRATADLGALSPYLAYKKVQNKQGLVIITLTRRMVSWRENKPKKLNHERA